MLLTRSPRDGTLSNVWCADRAANLTAYPTHELVPDVRYVAAESRLLLGKFDEAEKLYAELLQKYPQHPDAESWRVRQGTALSLQKKYPRGRGPVAAAGRPDQERRCPGRGPLPHRQQSGRAEAVCRGRTVAGGCARRRAPLATGRRDAAGAGAGLLPAEEADQGQGNAEKAGGRVPPEQGSRSGPFPSG